MPNNAIKKISREAKRLQRLHKGWQWKDCIRVASGNYNAGKLGSLPAYTPSSLNRGKVGSRKTGKVTARKRHNRPRIKKAVGTVKPASSKIAGAKLSNVTAATLTSELKRRINSDIDRAVVRKFRATGKRIKRKIQKTITEKKAALRRLS